MGRGKRHGPIHRTLTPERQRIAAAWRQDGPVLFRRGNQSGLEVIREKAGPPLIKEKERSGKGIEYTALGNEHRKGDAFPRNVVCALVIEELKGLKDGVTPQAAVKEKRGNAECST